MRPRGSAVALAVLIACAACSSGGHPTQAAPSASATGLHLTPGQTEDKLDTTFQYGGFSVRIGHAVWDPATKTLLVGVRFTNLSDRWSSPDVSVASLTSGGQSLSLLTPATERIPPRVSADLTLTVEGLAGNPVSDGVITWGKDSENRPQIPLSGSPGRNVINPAAVTLDGWANIGKYSVHVTRGHLLAGELNLNKQAPAGQRILRVFFDEWADRVDPVNGFYPLEHLTLKLPDGTTVDGADSSTGFAPQSWTTTAGNWIEFPVPDPPPGDVSLALSSLSTKGFSTVQPALIDHALIPLRLGTPTALAPTGGPVPVPVLPAASPSPSAPAAPVVEQLASGSLNVGGFSFTPRRLEWDPVTATATLDGQATYLQTESAPSGGLLSTTPQFSFNEALSTGGRLYAGIINGPAAVAPGAPVPISLQFLSVDHVDTRDAAIFAGPDQGAVSALALGADSSVASYPPAPSSGSIEAPAVSAGQWSVQLVSYRQGFLRTDTPPPPGQLDLEITMRVTAAPTAKVPALGLFFHPAVQVFRFSSDGYLIQAASDSGLVQYQPGQTQTQSVTFHVPDSFGAGSYGFVLRSSDESQDVTSTQFIETTFAAGLGTGAAVGQLGG